jgi:hypothetical protein
MAALQALSSWMMRSRNDSPAIRSVWERVIAEDFAEFRKAGLTHPMMADIAKELGVSP